MLQCDVNILIVEMGNFIDLTEKRFGKLTVLYRSKNNKKAHIGIVNVIAEMKRMFLDQI